MTARPHIARIGIALVMAWLSWPLCVSAQSSPPPTPAVSSQPPDEQKDAAAASDASKLDRPGLRDAFRMLLGILLLGLLLIFGTMLVGIRMRRALRQPLPVVSKGDPLWFLKPPRTPPDSTAETGHDSDPGSRPSGPDSSTGSKTLRRPQSDSPRRDGGTEPDGEADPGKETGAS